MLISCNVNILKYAINDICCRSFNFNVTRPVKHIIKEEVSDHPLKPMTIAVNDCRITRRLGGNSPGNMDLFSSSRIPTGIVLDPLGAALDGTDPLSQFAKQELDPLSETALDNVS